MQIVSKAGTVLCEVPGNSLRGADLSGADLRGADLSGADLREAYLRGADLREADLRGADLSGADLRGADLSGADLREAYLRGADLREADLRGADLSGSYLRWADVSGADLSGADLAWTSHDLIAEILLRAAGENIQQRMVAGLILVLRDWCWRDFLGLDIEPALREWALTELRKWVRDGDGAPGVLKEST